MVYFMVLKNEKHNKREILVFNIKIYFISLEYQPNSISERASQVPSNKMLANYLARENPEYDDFIPQGYGKRSMFRERGEIIINQI